MANSANQYFFSQKANRHKNESLARPDINDEGSGFDSRAGDELGLSMDDRVGFLAWTLDVVVVVTSLGLPLPE